MTSEIDAVYTRFILAFEESGLTQAEAGTELGLSEGAISKKIRGAIPVKKRDADAMELVAKRLKRPATITGVAENSPPYDPDGSPEPRFPFTQCCALTPPPLSVVISSVETLVPVPAVMSMVSATIRLGEPQ